jgi:opacity protein-like surface antigen
MRQSGIQGGVTMKRVLFAAAAATLALSLGAARAETEIRLARQFSMGYLQFNVMETRS